MLAGVFVCPTSAIAACQVRASAGAVPWEQAARDAERRLSEARQDTHDCGQIEVLVRPDGSAVVRFFTRDGRVAERSVAQPDELGPLVEALVAASSPAPRATEPPTSGTAAPTSPAPAAPPPATELVWSVGLGGRASAPGGKLNRRYLSPAFEVGAGGVVGLWELGVLGEWAPSYVDRTKTDPPGFAMSSVLFGVHFGRRIPVWKATGRVGFVAAVMQVHSEADAANGGEPPLIDRAQTRVGVHAGAALPSSAATRFAVDLRGEGVVARTGRSTAVDRTLPPLPGFAVVLTLGVEGRVL